MVGVFRGRELGGGDVDGEVGEGEAETGLVGDATRVGFERYACIETYVC